MPATPVPSSSPPLASLGELLARAGIERPAEAGAAVLAFEEGSLGRSDYLRILAGAGPQGGGDAR